MPVGAGNYRHSLAASLEEELTFEDLDDYLAVLFVAFQTE